MQKRLLKILLILLFTPGLRGQEKEIDRLMDGELKMTFPSIYFKHNSTEYAPMPYTADSCFKYITKQIKDINSFVIWRDSSEAEQLTYNRIKKLKAGLNTYKPSRRINIQSMGKEQKISRHTIEMSANNNKTQYLLSLNSVFDISKSRFSANNKLKNHIAHPRLSCWGCWSHCFHIATRMKLRKAARHNKITNGKR